MIQRGPLPLDPMEMAPGVKTREADLAITSDFGPNSPIGYAKGNRSADTLPPRIALTGPGPFKNLHGGK